MRYCCSWEVVQLVSPAYCLALCVNIKMQSVEEFAAAPSHEALDQCSKDQLLKIAEHYELQISSSFAKDKVKAIVRSNLAESGVLPGAEKTATSSFASVSMEGLSFEQRKELLRLQIDHEKFKVSAEHEKAVTLEKIRQETEQVRLEFEHKLQMEREAKVHARPHSRLESGSDVSSFDVLSNVRLMPKFSESDPDSFFLLFDRVAEAREWPDSVRTLMLSSVLTGRAQEVYSAMSSPECEDYVKVKDTILKAYERVPEFYRQRFRTWKKGYKQTHLEFVRDLKLFFSRWCTAAEVDDYDSLRELIVLEQFKNSVPERVATHISEQKVRKVLEAAAIADDYVLIHQNTNAAERRGQPAHGSGTGVPAGGFTGQSRTVQSGAGNFGGFRSGDKVCDVCHKRGHLRADCYSLKSSRYPFGPGMQAKGAGLAVPGQHHEPNAVPVDSQVQCADTAVLDPYAPFVRMGYVSMVGSDVGVPVKILRDTGAFDSFIRGGVLPLSKETEVGSSVLVRGMGMSVLHVPLHKVILHCDLFQGETVLAVRPALPIKGVSVILGNNIAGAQMWPDCSPALLTESRPCLMSGPDECERDFPDTFAACAVTRAMAQEKPERATPGECSVPLKFSFPMSDFPVSVPRSELVTEQNADRSLAGLYGQVRPPGEMEDSACGYFLEDSLLVRKWTVHAADVSEDPLFQIVLPTKWRHAALKVAHDEAGHSGIAKTYDRVQRHFFWPGLKRDVAAYVKTCHTCQLTGKPNQVLRPAPLYPIPALGQPFDHLIIDCVGPLPRSKSGSLYLLTVMCQNTRYPAAYPLRSISTKPVVRALSIYFRLWYPKDCSV